MSKYIGQLFWKITADQKYIQFCFNILTESEEWRTELKV